MSVTAPEGFVASGVAAGVKEDGALDLALVATADGRAVPAAGVFTANRMTAAPVIVSSSHLRATAGSAGAVVLNAGNANAANGEQGEAHAEAMCAEVASHLGLGAQQVLVCSTGLIGIPLPVERILEATSGLVAARAREGAGDAARAIMTTDTHPKEVVVEGEGFTVGGMAKGAAMLAPNMATMLAVLTTDAQVDAATLHEVLRAGVAGSFNVLTVDGCTSTNDTVLLLASGRRGPVDPAGFAAAVADACEDLAAQMAGDAEGATKVVRVRVHGAHSDEEAAVAARRIAESQLVKCSWYGRDPYWGRIASEAGAAGVAFDQRLLEVAYGGVVVARGGVAVDHDRDAVARHMAERHLLVEVGLGIGAGAAHVLTNDLTHAYVDENMGTS